MNFMTFHILGMSSQLTNYVIFQRGMYTTNQYIYIEMHMGTQVS